MKSLVISEIYKSVQGESSFMGLPCAFIRLTGCPLRCRWCDTSYSFRGGKKMSFDEIKAEVEALGVSCIEFTGGEPLAQPLSQVLMADFVEMGKTVLLETSGSISVKDVPKGVHIILDMKCPGSKMSHKNHYENFDFLKASDEIKFVIGDREDYLWTKDLIDHYGLTKRFKVLLSPVWAELAPSELVSWFLEDKLEARLNLQLHKYIWDPTQKGV